MHKVTNIDALGALSPRKRGVVDRVLVSSQYFLGLL